MPKKILIQQKINTQLANSWEAKFNSWEGVAVSVLDPRREKHIKELDIAKSSGYPLLDEAAISTVESQSLPLPDFTGNLAWSNIDSHCLYMARFNTDCGVRY